MKSWISPDRKIAKTILAEGEFGLKPAPGSECTISKIEGDIELARSIIVGDNTGIVGRNLDIAVCTMHKGEIAEFYFSLSSGRKIMVVFQLSDFVFDGFLFDWDAEKKYKTAMKYKEIGNTLIKEDDIKEAAYMFNKALKLLCIIPISVEEKPTEIDGISIEQINLMKSSLYNNLSVCYFRNESWEVVLGVCKKILEFNEQNVRALYKSGVAYKNLNNYEKAFEMLSKVLEIEPHNKAAIEQCRIVKGHIVIAENRVNGIVKKMFG